MGLFDNTPEPTGKVYRGKSVEFNPDQEQFVLYHKGHGTRSANKSPEQKRLNDERKRITEAYEHGELTFEPIDIPPVCTCLDKPYPHDAHRMELQQFQSDCKRRDYVSGKRGNNRPTGKDSRSRRRTPPPKHANGTLGRTKRG